ncbi:hypothetical protein GCM10028895_30500 [Pontibacter rugosus]
MDGDGDLDMLIGNRASYRNEVYGGSLSYYRNTGTADAPAFELVTDDYLKLHNQQAYSIKPAFADINGDGAVDLVLTFKGVQAGSNRVMYMQNLAAKGQPAAYDLALLQVLLRVGDGDIPAFADVDGDGDLDIVLGKASSMLEFYRNTGTATAPIFTLENDSFGGINYNYARRNVHPAMYDIDGNGQLDLLTVDESGEMRIFRNFTENLNGAFTAESEILENELTKQVHVTKFGQGLSITVAPLGGKHKNYAVVGTQGGGLYLLEQTAGNVANPAAGEGLALTVYPNPYEGVQADMPLRIDASEPVKLEIYDTIGKQVYRSQGKYSRNHSLTLQQWQAGLYIIRAVSESGEQASRKLLVR